MAEDVVEIELTFDSPEQCKKVNDIFYRLRAARRRETEWPSDQQIIEEVGMISDKAKQLLLTPLKGSDDEKAWLLEEIKPNKAAAFESQWSYVDIEGAWVEKLEILEIFEPDDFPKKKGKNENTIRVMWMWNRCYLVTAALMIKMFKELGAIKVKSKVSYENG